MSVRAATAEDREAVVNWLTSGPLSAADRWISEPMPSAEDVQRMLAGWRFDATLTQGSIFVDDEHRAIGGARDPRGGLTAIYRRDPPWDAASRIGSSLYPAGLSTASQKRMFSLARAAGMVIPPRPTAEVLWGFASVTQDLWDAWFLYATPLPTLVITVGEGATPPLNLGFVELATRPQGKDGCPSVTSWLHDASP